MSVDPNDKYWTQALGDPSVTAATGSARKQLIALLMGFGDPSQLTADQRTTYGITDNDLSGAATNPYSTQMNLAKQLSGNQYGIQNNNNAHGTLFSGVHAAQQAGELQAGGQRNYDAQRSLASQLAGIDDTRTQAITNAYGRISTNEALKPLPIPAVPDAPPAPPAGPPPQAGPAVNGLGTPWVDPGQRENLVQPPPNPTPKVKTAAQIAAQAKRGFIGHA